MRLDKWLWAARFYKTRRIAVDEINKGRVLVEGSVAKPSKVIAIANKIVVNKFQERFEITVLKLIETRGSASIAITMYEESDESSTRRMHERELRKLSHVARPEHPGRRDKRKLRDLRQGNYKD